MMVEYNGVTPTIEQTFEELKEELKAGKTTTFFSVKAKIGLLIKEREKKKTRVEELNKLLESHDLNVHILPEQDLSVYGEPTEDIQAFVSQPYVIIEFHRTTVPAYAERIIYEIQLAGYTPVILNPERNVEFIQNPNRLYQLVKNGALSQISAESILGDNGKTIKKKSIEMLKANLIHLVASSEDGDVIGTNNSLQRAHELIQKRAGKEALFLLKENAYLLVKGESLIREVPHKISKRKWL